MLNLFMENDGKRAVWRKDVVSPSKSKGKSKSKTINLTSSDDDEEDVLAPKPKSKGAAAQAAKKARPAPEEKSELASRAESRVFADLSTCPQDLYLARSLDWLDLIRRRRRFHGTRRQLSGRPVVPRRRSGHENPR